MSAFVEKNDVSGYGGYGHGAGYGGFGGGWCAILGVIVVLWLLFKDGHRDGHKDGHGFYGCGPATRPYFPDESNYEQDYKMSYKFDRVYDKECMIEKTVVTDGAATRALIEQKYIQELRDKLTEKNAEVLTLKSEAFTSGLFNTLNAKIDHLSCEVPKRMPTWAQGAIPCNTTTVTGCGEPKRGSCSWDRD